MQTYPNIKPNFIKNLELPEYKISETEWKSGFSNVKRESFQGINIQISLEYQHLNETETTDLIDFYSSVKGTNTGFKLPADFIWFPELAIEAIQLLESTTVWKFETEPIFTLLVATPERGKYNTVIQLRAVSNDITEENEVSTLSDTVYEVVAEPISGTLPDNDQDVEVGEGDGVDSDNPDPVEDTTQENTRLLRSETTLAITETITPGADLLKTIDLAGSLLLIKVSCDQEIRLRIYNSEVKRTEDLTRGLQIINYANHGLLFEGFFTATIQTILTTPGTFLYTDNNENKTYFLTITNLDSVSISNFNITFNYVPIEV